MKCVVKLVCFVILFSMVSTLFIACSKVDEVEENSTLQA